MTFKRLFAFGCSYTSYCPPTWADIISWDLNIPTQNWALSGMGNVGIFHRMVECDLKNNFNEDDLIVVLWSSWNREDRYTDRWATGGSVFNSPHYNDEFVKKYWTMSNDIIKNSTAIISANKMFNVQFQGHIVPPYMDEDSRLLEFDVDETKILDLYKPHIPTDNIFYYNGNTEFNELFGDSHPDILEHLKYVKEVVYPSLNLTIKKELEDFCYELHEELLKILNDNKHRPFEEKRVLLNDFVCSRTSQEQIKRYLR
jgi:hypothetical protein